MFHLTQKFSKGLWAFIAVFAVSASLLSALAIPASTVNAADPTPKSGGCVGNGVSTALTSPFTKTPNMCLGDDTGAGRRFYQFAVKLNEPVAISVTGVSGNGTSISFVKESNLLYVSKADSNSMGYAAYTIGTNTVCNVKEKSNIVTLTIKGPGSNNTDTKVINLCSYKGASSQSLVYYTTTIKNASGATTATTGTIKGNLGIERTESIVPDNQKKAKLNKDYVTSFVLNGPTKINGGSSLPASSNKGTGFDLTDGILTIEGLKAGSYTLKIVYNDLAAISAAGGDPGWTKEVTFDFIKPTTNLLAGQTVWLNGSSASQTFYASSGVSPENQSVKEDVPSSCLIEGLGWIVCPVINLLAAVADQSFTFLADSFLKTDPNVFNTENGTYKAWSIMRNIANILFVIAFLFIVFSQLTGMGVSNYGVKKMLPRIVIAAILVNVSYFISQLAIDVSNILGYSIRDVFNGITFEAAKASGGKIAGGVLAGGEDGFVALAGTILGFAAAGAAIYLMLAAFGPIILAVVLALILILFILVARQAIVILLVILSPIAFVAFLLPNTESLFKQWKKIFVAMLMLFPIIALVFGVSKLASTLLQESFTGVSGVSADATNVFGQIIASAVLVLPLFAVPVLLKKSLDSVPMLGQMANKMANKSFAGVSSKVKEGNRGSIFGRGAAIRKQGRENYRSKRFAEKITGGGAMGAINRAVAGGIPLPYDKAGKASRDSLQKVATAATYRAQVEEVEDAKKLIENENLSGLERQDLAMKGTVKTKSGKIINGEVAQKAAIQMQLAGAGSMSNIHEIVSASSGTLSKYSQTIGQGALASSTKDPALSGKSIDNITQGKFNHEEAIKLAFSQGKYTAESVASMHIDSREKAITVARAAEAAGDPSLMEKLRSAVKGIESTPQLMAKFAGDDDGTIQLQKISGTVVQAAPTQPAKIEFTSTSGGLPQPDGTVMPKISTAQEVITQVASAGGWDKISHEDLFAAKEHATKTLSHVNDAATNKLGSDAIDEMQRRNMTPGPLNPNQGRTPPPTAPTPPPTAPPNP